MRHEIDFFNVNVKKKTGIVGVCSTCIAASDLLSYSTFI